MIVDSVSEVLRLPDKQIQEAPDQVADGRSHLIMGVGKLDERLLIILNLESILSDEEQLALNGVSELAGGAVSP